MGYQQEEPLAMTAGGSSLLLKNLEVVVVLDIEG